MTVLSQLQKARASSQLTKAMGKAASHLAWSRPNPSSPIRADVTRSNVAAAMLRNLQGFERIAFVAGTAPQILGEELITILPFLGLLTLLHARGKLSRRRAVALAWIGSSLLFGALHLSTYQWRIDQALLVIGGARLVLTLPYLLTKNLWASTITHITHDWSLFAVIFLLSAPP